MHSRYPGACYVNLSVQFIGQWKEVATKYVRGAAYTNVVASKTNTAMLSTCGVVLRVHTSSGASASDSVTRYTCGSKDLSYWSGYGGLNGSYQLWGQVAQSAGNTGTRVGGEWAP